MVGLECGVDILAARIKNYKWLFQYSTFTSFFGIGKKLLSIFHDGLEMKPLNASILSSKFISFLQLRSPNRRSVSNDTLLLVPTSLIRVLLNMSAFYRILLMKDFILKHFEKSDLKDGIA